VEPAPVMAAWRNGSNAVLTEPQSAPLAVAKSLYHSLSTAHEAYGGGAIALTLVSSGCTIHSSALLTR